MSDPYRITEAGPGARPAAEQGTAEPARLDGAGRGMLRPVLWVLLIIAAAGNAVASTSTAHVLVGVGLGVVVLGLATALIVHHYRHRRP